ncbi:MAG: hypothetical protein DMG91_05590 [Acidobacteria bacterium]|nr:MAG: hypothetical protein DMG91_05590 [Acidobacteriota bacterium]
MPLSAPIPSSIKKKRVLLIDTSAHQRDKPEYLANAPKANGEASVQTDDEQVQVVAVRAALSAASSDLPQRWGILEASQRISAVRSASVARTRAMRERPAPPRDSEVRASKRNTPSTTLDDLLREEMQ